MERRITIMRRTVKATKPPDIDGFIQAMRDMGAKVSSEGTTIVIDFRKQKGVMKE